MADYLGWWVGERVGRGKADYLGWWVGERVGTDVLSQFSSQEDTKLLKMICKLVVEEKTAF